MVNALNFGFKLLLLHLAADFSQIRLKYSDHSKQYRGKKASLSVTISSTFHCNLNCRHCASEINNTKQDSLSSKRFLNLIDEMAASGVVKVGFTGGEPLMREDMCEILGRCYENKLLTSLVSNSWLVPKYIDKLRRLSVLFLSLDGNKEVDDYIRGEGHWDKFNEAVALAKKNKIPVTALTNLNGMNYKIFDQFPEIFKKLNISWMVGRFEDAFGVGDEANFPPQERIGKGSAYSVPLYDINKMLNRIEKSRKLRTSKKYLDFMRGRHKISRCYAGIGYCVISPYGKMYPCFQASFDPDYDGISILDKDFNEAFHKMPLYRKTCNACIVNCHAEANYLYEFNPSSILNAYLLTK